MILSFVLYLKVDENNKYSRVARRKLSMWGGTDVKMGRGGTDPPAIVHLKEDIMTRSSGSKINGGVSG